MRSPARRRFSKSQPTQGATNAPGGRSAIKMTFRQKRALRHAFYFDSAFVAIPDFRDLRALQRIHQRY